MHEIEYIKKDNNIIARFKRPAVWVNPEIFYCESIKVSDLRGVAKLHPQDKDNYNEEFGKTLARKRLLKKYFTRLNNEIKERIFDTEQELVELTKIHNKFTKSKNRVEEVLNRMIKYSKGE